MKKGNEKSKNLTFGVRLTSVARLSRSPICILQFAILLSGCVAYQVGGDMQQGRLALMYGDPKVALAHFQRAADSDPDYLLNFSLLDEGVWTYVGRAYYAMEKLPEAQQALMRARSRHEQDHLAKLYLGLALMRDGDRQRGLRETEGGLKGLGDWLEDVQRNLQEGIFWDPGGELRREIQKSLAMIKGRDIIWTELIASGEWLGQGFEEEIDLAKRDEFNEETQDSDDDPPM